MSAVLVGKQYNKIERYHKSLIGWVEIFRTFSLVANSIAFVGVHLSSAEIFWILVIKDWNFGELRSQILGGGLGASLQNIGGCW